MENNILKGLNCSSRKYQIAVLEVGIHGLSLSEMSLSQILESDYEVCYCLHEMIDEMLDLKIGQSVYFQPVRDIDTSKAIIVRIA